MFNICKYLFVGVNLMILCQAQLISFKDGKIGVNFGGYHAEAGLGALFTGNAAHGGLSASAGTPYGQRAAAGLGAGTAENSQGGAYASASAGGDVGASAGLGGVVGGEAGLGAEAHAGSLSSSATQNNRQGFQVSRTRNNNAIYRNSNNGGVGSEFGGNLQTQTQFTNEFDNDNRIVAQESNIQRIRPSRKITRRVHGNAHVAQSSNESSIIQEIENPSNIQENIAVASEKQNLILENESVLNIDKTAAIPAQVNFHKELSISSTGTVGNNVNSIGNQQTVTSVKTLPVIQQEQPQKVVYEKSIVTAPAVNAGAHVTYVKHFRPWRRLHFRKHHVVPVYYEYEQPQTIAVVDKAVAVKSQNEPVVKTKVITKTKSIAPAVPYQPHVVNYNYEKEGAIAGGGVGSGQLSGNFNAQGFFDSIFNIPIATLKAVNGLVNNVASSVSASGNVAITKSKSFGVSSN